MTIQYIQWTIALLARQTARIANRQPELNDIADALYVFCVKIGVPEGLLPQ